jgi:hypothetical protein
MGGPLEGDSKRRLHIATSAAIINRRPRRDSNAQPTDSKSGALSIELRGQATKTAHRNQRWA